MMQAGLVVIIPTSVGDCRDDARAITNRNAKQLVRELRIPHQKLRVYKVM